MTTPCHGSVGMISFFSIQIGKEGEQKTLCTGSVSVLHFARVPYSGERRPGPLRWLRTVKARST